MSNIEAVAMFALSAMQSANATSTIEMMRYAKKRCPVTVSDPGARMTDAATNAGIGFKEVKSKAFLLLIFFLAP